MFVYSFNNFKEIIVISLVSAMLYYKKIQRIKNCLYLKTGESYHKSIRFNNHFQTTKIKNNRIISNFRNVNFYKLRAEISDIFKDKLNVAVKKHNLFTQKRVSF